MNVSADITKVIQEHKYKVVIGFNLLLMVVCYLIRKPVFWTNDDWLMTSLLSGIYGVEYATPYVRFVNIILSTGLYYLYKLAHTINWFGVIQALIIFLSWTTLSIYYIEKKKDEENAGIYYLLLALFLIIFAPWVYTRIQFSQTAEIGCFAGALFFLYSYEGSNEKKNRIIRVVAIAIMMTAAFYRMACLLLVCPFIFSIFVLQLIAKKDIKKNLKINLKLLIIMLVIYIAGSGIHEIVYEKWNDQGYIEFDLARADYVDYAQKPYNEIWVDLVSYGITYNDYVMASSLIYNDPVNIDTEFFENLCSLQEKETMSVGKIVTATKSFLRDYKGVMGLNTYYAFLIIGIILCVCNYKNAFVFGCYLLGVNAIAWFFTVVGRYPEYIKNMTFIMASYLVLVCAKGISNKRIKEMVALAAFAGCIYLNNQGYVVNASENDTDSLAYETHKAINEYDEYVFVLEQYNLSVIRSLKESYSAFETPEQGLYSNIIKLGDWTIRHPASDTHMESLEIYSPMLQIADDNVYVLAEPETLMLMTTYLREHTGIEASFGKVMSIYETPVFKVTPSELEFEEYDFLEEFSQTRAGWSDENAMMAVISEVKFGTLPIGKEWNIYYHLKNTTTGKNYNIIAYEGMKNTIMNDEDRTILIHMPMEALNDGCEFEIRVVLEDCETGRMYCDEDTYATVEMVIK